MDKQSKALINEIYRLVGANTLQVQNLQNNVSHLESLVKDMHCDVLERPAEKKVVLLKTAPFGANPSEVLKEYDRERNRDITLQEIRDTMQKMREDLLKPRTAHAYYEIRCECGNRLKPTPAPPEPPRLSAQFAQFMQEDMERRGYIYRYARYPEYRKLWMDTDLYFKTHTDLYDNEAFLKLLAELPPRCII